MRIGPYGRGIGKWSLKAAREEWERIRTWSRETGQDPRELRKEEKQKVQERVVVQPSVSWWMPTWRGVL